MTSWFHIWQNATRIHKLLYKSLDYLFARGERLQGTWAMCCTPIPCGRPFIDQYIEGFWVAFALGKARRRRLDALIGRCEKEMDIAMRKYREEYPQD